MKKKIVLIDLKLELIKSICESKKVDVELLITDDDAGDLAEIKDLYGIKNITTRSQFHNYTVQEVSDIDYDTIEEFKASQLNSEHFQSRLSDDANLMQYHYFNALSFWIHVFTKNDISAVVLDGLMHGANYDSLALDVAKSYGVAGYVIESHMARHVKNEVAAVRSVLDYNLKKRVFLDNCKLDLKSVDIDNYLFYADKMDKNPLKKRKSIKGTINTYLPSYTYVTLLMLANIIRNKPIYLYGLYSSSVKVLRNIFYVRKMRKFYDAISVDFDASKKYVFFAFHFEPEANIMARAKFSNQLIIVKQLSQSLPRGWVLYVKEHPDQFTLYKQGWWYYLISIHKYRTKVFYKELLKFDNVRLLKQTVKSKNVIESAEAVVTINGSIASEALAFNKPLMLFGHESTPIGLCKDVFKVTSSEQCKKYIEQIKNDFIPDYSDFDMIVDNYLFELTRSPSNDLQLLVDYLVCDYNDWN